MSYTRLTANGISLVSFDDGLDYWSSHITVNGPWEYGGWLFGAWAAESTGTPNRLAVLGSDDAGATWAELDAANCPGIWDFSGHPEAIGVLGGLQDGSTLYIACAEPLGAPNACGIQIVPFDLAARSWGTPITGGPMLFTDVSAMSQCAILFRKSDGSFRVVHNAKVVPPSGGAGAAVSKYSGGVWSGPTYLGADILAYSAAMDSDERIHVYGRGYSTSYNLPIVEEVLLANDTLAGSQTIASDMLSTNANPPMAIARSGGDLVLPYPRAVEYTPPVSSSQSVWGHIAVLEGAPADQPTYAAQEASYLGSLASDAAYGWMRIAVVEYRGQVCCLWLHPETGETAVFAATRAGSTWGAPGCLYDTVSDSGTPDRGWLTALQARALSGGIGCFIRIRESVESGWKVGIYYMLAEAAGAGCRNYVY